ncbi:hypothetical protein ACQ4PT_051147 [Festuca glaucescens]
MPAHLIHTSDEPGPDSDLEQLLGGIVSSSSGADGLLLLTCVDGRLSSPILAQQGGKQVRHQTGELADGHETDFTYLVCNPLSGQVSRVPIIGYTTNILRDTHMGLLAQSDRGHDRFAVARLYSENKMVRFLSDTGKWDLVQGAPGPCQHRLARRIGISLYHEVLAFAGRLWWVDLTCGAMSADPFSNWTETHFVELPKASVLPEAARRAEAELLFNYRRMGVSEGRLRYVELSQREPFVLSSFALDEEGSGDWTLEHRVALSRVWAADGGAHPWLPLQGDTTPHIGVLDPLNANFIHIIVGQHVIAVDMQAGKVTGSSVLPSHMDHLGFIPCMLASTRIPSSTGNDMHFLYKKVYPITVSKKE